MIYTSYFSNADKIPNTLRKLSISTSKKVTLDGRIGELAPTWTLVQNYKNGTINSTEYTIQYNKQLEKLDPAIVPDNCVLFCYEKPGDFCHRHLVAQWLNKHGIPCEEWTTAPTFGDSKEYLSNMYPYKMRVNGLEFTCVEAAFQSFKTTDPEIRKQFIGLDGRAAKALGRKINLRPDWEQIKIKVMRQLIAGKFSKSLGQKLVKEQDNFIETDNELGRILMEVRAKLLAD